MELSQFPPFPPDVFYIIKAYLVGEDMVRQKSIAGAIKTRRKIERLVKMLKIDTGYDKWRYKTPAERELQNINEFIRGLIIRDVDAALLCFVNKHDWLKPYTKNIELSVVYNHYYYNITFKKKILK